MTPAPAERPEPAGERRPRGRDELLEVRRLRELPFVAFEAVNRGRGSRYPVYLPAAPSLEGGMCTCEDFARRGRGTCKHLEAVGQYVAEHPDEATAGSPSDRADVTARWAEIDARIAQLEADHRPWTNRLRRVGRVLIEPLAT